MLSTTSGTRTLLPKNGPSAYSGASVLLLTQRTYSMMKVTSIRNRMSTSKVPTLPVSPRLMTPTVSAMLTNASI